MEVWGPEGGGAGGAGEFCIGACVEFVSQDLRMGGGMEITPQRTIKELRSTTSLVLRKVRQTQPLSAFLALK